MGLPKLADITTSAASTPEDGTDLAQLTDSFHLNLTAFGLLSFAVGLFIVQSAIGLAFEQRRSAFRTLRALGLSLRRLMVLLAPSLAGSHSSPALPRPRARLCHRGRAAARRRGHPARPLRCAVSGHAELRSALGGLPPRHRSAGHGRRGRAGALARRPDAAARPCAAARLGDGVGANAIRMQTAAAITLLIAAAALAFGAARCWRVRLPCGAADRGRAGASGRAAGVAAGRRPAAARATRRMAGCGCAPAGPGPVAGADGAAARAVGEYGRRHDGRLLPHDLHRLARPALASELYVTARTPDEADAIRDLSCPAQRCGPADLVRRDHHVAAPRPRSTASPIMPAIAKLAAAFRPARCMGQARRRRRRHGERTDGPARRTSTLAIR